MRPIVAGLAHLQCWMQDAITGSAGAIAAQYVRAPAGGLGARQRIEVYRRSYWTRLLGAMGELFPALKTLLGEPLFDDFARGFLLRHPPVGHDIAHAVYRFPAYLRTSGAAFARGEHWIDMLVDLSRLEVAALQVATGRGSEYVAKLEPAMVADASALTLSSLRVGRMPGVRIVSCAYPMHLYALAVGEGVPPTLAPRRRCHVVLFRRFYRMHTFEIGAVGARLLRRIGRRTPLQTAIAHARIASPEAARDWLVLFATHGLLRAPAPDPFARGRRCGGVEQKHR